MNQCPSCGVENVGEARFCVKCGTALSGAPAPESWRDSTPLNSSPFGSSQPGNPASSADPTSGYQPSNMYAPPPAPTGYPPTYPSSNMGYMQQGGMTNWQDRGANKKLPAGICGILIGSLGIHKFILGYNTEGIIMLLITLLTCGIGAMVTGIIGLVEGIIYITKSDEDFVRTYVENKRGWF